MSAVLLPNALNHLSAVKLRSDEWTAVIPAAGKGSRLGYSRPKALFPVLGRPLIDWVLEPISRYCAQAVVIVSPEDEHSIREALGDKRGNLPIDFQLQHESKGTADAVWCSRPSVRTPHTLVIWADQISVQPQTLELCMKAHLARPGAELTFPTAMREKPYISLVRDNSGRILAVEQARESRISTSSGESDCGLFLFATARLFEELERAALDEKRRGAATGELNLLSLIPEFDKQPGACACVRVSSPDETRGVNTAEEARHLETLLGESACQSTKTQKTK